MKNYLWVLLLVVLVGCQPADGGGQSAGSGSLERSSNEENGKLLGEGYLRGGEKDGSWITYHKRNGLVESVVGYRNGLRQGPYMKADDKGSVTERGFYVDDKLEGPRVRFTRTRVKEESNYTGGKLEGARKLFYDNGKIQEEGNFKDGKRHGENKWYDQEENVTIAAEYANGEKVKDLPVPPKKEKEE